MTQTAAEINMIWFDLIWFDSEPCGLEEDMDLVWEEMRVGDEVRIHKQFWSYLGRQEDLQVGDYVYVVVLPLITNLRKLVIK